MIYLLYGGNVLFGFLESQGVISRRFEEVWNEAGLEACGEIKMVLVSSDTYK